jgi:hypothetical protein
MADPEFERKLPRRRENFRTARERGDKRRIATEGLKFARDLVSAGLVEHAATVLGQVATHFETKHSIRNIPAPARLRRWLDAQFNEGELGAYLAGLSGTDRPRTGAGFEISIYESPSRLIAHVETLLRESAAVESPEDLRETAAAVGPLPGNGGTDPPV